MGRVVARIAIVVSAVAGILMGGLAWARPDTPVRLPVSVVGDPSPQTVVVVKGDHLWKISARHLDHVLGREVENAEISAYWRRVIETNRPHLRSGDPDLIYPGEIVQLPETAVSERQ